MKNIIGASIHLQSGNYYDYHDPENSQYTIYDVAHALSMKCRFNGHVDFFYSVAQHSVLGAQEMPTRELAYEFLMHDASEAFISDMVTPLKNLFPEYRELEHRVELDLAKRFRIPYPMSPEVKIMDRRMLITEKQQLKDNYDTWSGDDGLIAIDKRIVHWTPERARSEFLSSYYELKP